MIVETKYNQGQILYTPKSTPKDDHFIPSVDEWYIECVYITATKNGVIIKYNMKDKNSRIWLLFEEERLTELLFTKHYEKAESLAYEYAIHKKRKFDIKFINSDKGIF